MPLDTALDELKAAYDKVAHEMEQAHPAIWARLEEWYRANDNKSKVRMMLKENPPYLLHYKSILEVADEYGDDAVIKRIDIERQGIQIRMY